MRGFLLTDTYMYACWMTRYVLEYLPDTAIICATLPDGIVANLEAPYGWPMPGIALVVRSLILANSSCKANFLSTSQHMMVRIQCSLKTSSLHPPFILILAVKENIVVSSVFACDAFDSVHNLVYYYCAGSCQLNCKVWSMWSASVSSFNWGSSCNGKTKCKV